MQSQLRRNGACHGRNFLKRKTVNFFSFLDAKTVTLLGPIVGQESGCPSNVGEGHLQ